MDKRQLKKVTETEPNDILVNVQLGKIKLENEDYENYLNVDEEDVNDILQWGYNFEEMSYGETSIPHPNVGSEIINFIKEENDEVEGNASPPLEHNGTMILIAEERIQSALEGAGAAAVTDLPVLEVNVGTNGVDGETSEEEPEETVSDNLDQLTALPIPIDNEVKVRVTRSLQTEANELKKSTTKRRKMLTEKSDQLEKRKRSTSGRLGRIKVIQPSIVTPSENQSTILEVEINANIFSSSADCSLGQPTTPTNAVGNENEGIMLNCSVNLNTNKANHKQGSTITKAKGGTLVLQSNLDGVVGDFTAGISKRNNVSKPDYAYELKRESKDVKRKPCAKTSDGTMEQNKVVNWLEVVLGQIVQQGTGQRRTKWTKWIPLLKICRSVCKTWKASVDGLLETHSSNLELSMHDTLSLVKFKETYSPCWAKIRSYNLNDTRKTERYLKWLELNKLVKLDSTNNPLPSRHLIIKATRSDFLCLITWERFLKVVSDYLSKFGEQIWYLTVSMVCRNFLIPDDNGACVYKVLCEWLELTPNLKSLAINVSCLFQTKESRLNLKDCVEKLELPRLKHLETFQSGCQYKDDSFVELFLKKNSHVKNVGLNGLKLEKWG